MTASTPDKKKSEQAKTDFSKKTEQPNNIQVSAKTKPHPPKSQYVQKVSTEIIAESGKNYQAPEKYTSDTQKTTNPIDAKAPQTPEIRFNSPETLWHKLIQEMGSDRLNHPQLKYYMQEAKPESIDNNTLTVCYDEEFKSLHAERIQQDLPLLNTCIARITGIKNFKLRILQQKGLVTPVHKLKQVDLKEVREKISNNDFVQKALKLFDGSIVDIRG